MSVFLVLMDNKAHERLLQKLGSIPDQQISFEDLCEQENGKDCLSVKESGTWSLSMCSRIADVPNGSKR
jgi:hypothetical protein